VRFIVFWGFVFLKDVVWVGFVVRRGSWGGGGGWVFVLVLGFFFVLCGGRAGSFNETLFGGKWSSMSLPRDRKKANAWPGRETRNLLEASNRRQRKLPYQRKRKTTSTEIQREKKEVCPWAVPE